MHFQKDAHSNVCPNIVPKICLTHLAEIIDASVWLLTRKGSVNSSQHGHHQAQVAFIQKIRACIILRFLSISQMSACYQALMGRSSNYLLSRFVFDHLWGIPGDTEDHQVKSLGMNICNIASTGSGCCRAISLWLFVTRVYGANGHQQRLCLFVGINKHAFASRWNFYKSFALNKLEVKPRLLLFPTRRGLGLSPTGKNISHCT